MVVKVMLVDDEMLVRLGIKSLIEWEAHGFQFMGDAPDGAKALELMEDGPPDILLTDIVMPNMNGIELIEAVRRRYPDTLIIVLSSHNEYDYVRKAMKLGVEDYLLKTSLRPEELLGLLIATSGKLQERGILPELTPSIPNQQSTARPEAAAWLGRVLAYDGDGLPPEAAAIPLDQGAILMAVRIVQIREGVPHHSAAGLMKHMIEAELKGLIEGEPVQITDRDFAALLKPDEDGLAGMDARLGSLLNASGSLLGIEAAARVSAPMNGWRDAKRLYAALLDALEEGIPRQKEATREDIRTLLRYLEEHYAEQVTLRDAAERICMSEAYLSTVFKRETGIGFVDWINQLRVEKAASFLTATDLPSYLISERVGYENSNYFGRIFKKIKGVSPQKYRTDQSRGRASIQKS